MENIFKRWGFGHRSAEHEANNDAEDREYEVDSDSELKITDGTDTYMHDGMYMKISFATDTGLIRKHNEDSFFIDGKYRHSYGRNECDSYIELSDCTHIYGVFDGMGGEAFGETASAIAAFTLDRMYEKLSQIDASELPYYMNEYTRAANNAICEMYSDRHSGRSGSTMTAICIKDGTAYPFYLGDSRIYLYEKGSLLQITEDQTLAVRKIKAGVYTKEESENSPDHHKLTCFLGADEGGLGLDCQPCMPIPLFSGTKLLMCSDGLTDMCSRSKIEKILTMNADNPAKTLVDAANSDGGKDNVTCVVIEVSEFNG